MCGRPYSELHVARAYIGTVFVVYCKEYNVWMCRTWRSFAISRVGVGGVCDGGDSVIGTMMWFTFSTPGIDRISAVGGVR